MTPFFNELAILFQENLRDHNSSRSCRLLNLFSRGTHTSSLLYRCVH